MTAELVSVALPKTSPVLTCALAGSALHAIAKQTSTASQRQTLIHPPGVQAPTEWSCKIEQRSGMGLRLFGGRLEVQMGANQVICHRSSVAHPSAWMSQGGLRVSGQGRHPAADRTVERRDVLIHQP